MLGRFRVADVLTCACWLLQGWPELWSNDIRRIVASGLVTIGVLLALFAGVFRYVDQHFHTPEIFLENTSELATNADIRERLFNGFRSEIIALAEGDVPDEADGELGSLFEDDAAFDPITEERITRDQAIEEVLLDVFDSETYDRVFADALSRTQAQLIASAELEPEVLLRNKGEVFFNMQPLYQPIWLQLAADTRTSEITQTAPPDGYGVFKIADRETTMNFLWNLLSNGPNWRGLTMLGAIASLAGAAAVADRRPSTAIQFGGGMVGVGVVLIVIIYLIRFIVPLLAGGGSSANTVVAVYAANLAPLVSIMIRLVIVGTVLAAIGGIAKLIWPDDWVYSSVSDERGIRSIRRRRGAVEAELPAPQQQPQQLQPGAMAPGYGAGYAQPYPGYPQQWGQPQPYPGQYPPGYPTPYPAGPYAQPAQPLPQSQQQSQHYTSPGKPTVPVMPVQITRPGADMVPPAAPPVDAAPGDLPADAAQIVPRVVAMTNTTLDAASEATAAHVVVPTPDAPRAKAAVVEVAGPPAEDETSVAEAVPGIEGETDGAITNDEWSGEKDW